MSLPAITITDEEVGKVLGSNKAILSEGEVNIAKLLLAEKQHHLFNDWEAAGTNDAAKHAFFDQVRVLHESYNVPGGLRAYLNNARKLLVASRNGDNPFDGWSAAVPTGVTLSPMSAEYNNYERMGLADVSACGFVLVAGGLGERLGYNGIKVELPVEFTTGIQYLELYCKQILHMQEYKKFCTLGSVKADFLPLAIMVSDDTAAKTVALLESNNYFGLKKEQVTIMKQEKVAALLDNDGTIARESTYVVDAKPHGHGDVHALMYSTGTAKKWLDMGIRWCVFFQDTNGLAFHTLPAMIGVSKSLDLQLNSLAVPRVAKQAVGAITKLVHKDGVRSMTVNVEYNQLDPLLRATFSDKGDVNDAVTGKSPFPGNINQLLFQLEPYVATLVATHGVMSEFVNPKYADAAKNVFKKPTRLECMMQDYPKVLDASAKVGFTSLPAWLCFSPCKNNSTDAATAAASGVPAGSAFTAESDQYFAQAELLRLLGVSAAAQAPSQFLGISAIAGPRIAIHPSTAVFPLEYASRFPNPKDVSITPNSTLILEGDVIIKSLSLDGALKVVAAPGTTIVIDNRGEIKNAGYVMKAITNTTVETEKMRGYVIDKVEVANVETTAASEKRQYVWGSEKTLA